MTHPMTREGLVGALARALYAERFPGAALDEHFEWHRKGAANSDSCVHYSNVGIAFEHAKAALRALSASGMAEFELIQDGLTVAMAEGPREDAMREIRHYAAVYGRDGPVLVVEVLRVPVEIAAP